MKVRQAILMIVGLYLFNGAQLRPELPKMRESKKHRLELIFTL